MKFGKLKGKKKKRKSGRRRRLLCQTKDMPVKKWRTLCCSWCSPTMKEGHTPDKDDIRTLESRNKEKTQRPELLQGLRMLPVSCWRECEKRNRHTLYCFYHPSETLILDDSLKPGIQFSNIQLQMVYFCQHMLTMSRLLVEALWVSLFLQLYVLLSAFGLGRDPSAEVVSWFTWVLFMKWFHLFLFTWFWNLDSTTHSYVCYFVVIRTGSWESLYRCCNMCCIPYSLCFLTFSNWTLDLPLLL